MKNMLELIWLHKKRKVRRTFVYEDQRRKECKTKPAFEIDIFPTKAQLQLKIRIKNNHTYAE